MAQLTMLKKEKEYLSLKNHPNQGSKRLSTVYLKGRLPFTCAYQGGLSENQ